MLMSSRTKVVLKKSILKVLHIFEVYDKTFVMLGNEGPRKDVLIHVDKYGKKLYRLQFGMPMHSIQILNQEDVLVLETKSDVIRIISLKNKKSTFIQHHFMNQETDHANIFTFPNTKLFCVQENGRYNDNRLKLTYYDYPRPSHEVKALTKSTGFYERAKMIANTFKSTDQQWTFEWKVRKANADSMLIWYQQKNVEAFEFRFYHRNQEGIFEYKNLIIKHEVNDIFEPKFSQYAIFNCFHMCKDKLLILGQRKETVRVNNFLKQIAISETSIIDLKTQIVSPFTFEVAQKSQSFCDEVKDPGYFIDEHPINQNILMIRTYATELNGEPATSPIYYIDVKSRKTIARHEWKCTHENKYENVGYSGDILMETIYDNGNVEEFTVCIRQIVVPKEITMHFMLSLNPNFDDDLMEDVISMTQY